MSHKRRLLTTTLAITVLLFSGSRAAPLSTQTALSPEQPPSSPATAPDRKPDTRSSKELGVWHHFGEGRSPSAPAPSQSGGWRHFGGQNTLSPLSGRSGSRGYGFNPTRQMEEMLYELVNRDRADPANVAETHGQAMPLRWNDALAAVARAHSLDMMKRGYFAHQDPQGRDVAGRVEAAGMPWQALGENIAISASVAGAEGAFMNEPRFAHNHRANILSANFIDVGIGIVQAPAGRLYITQDFYTAPASTSAR